MMSVSMLTAFDVTTHLAAFRGCQPLNSVMESALRGVYRWEERDMQLGMIGLGRMGAYGEPPIAGRP